MRNLIPILIFFISVTGCKKDGKDHPCYDESLVHDGACITHCPGFEGCYGKTYCYECEGARERR
jgi:hypothetical protein